MADPKKKLEREKAPEESSVGLEGAAEKDAGFLREQPVEGGDELSIGGGPPSAAGGEVRSPAPTRDDIRAEEESGEPPLDEPEPAGL